MIAICRGWGMPARYVSGYLFTDRKAGDRSDPDATHAWVEVFLPSLRWVGFDPTNNIAAGERHIACAVGRDYSDVPPSRGVYKGEAESELAVGVTVRKARAAVTEPEFLRISQPAPRPASAAPVLRPGLRPAAPAAAMKPGRIGPLASAGALALGLMAGHVAARPGSAGDPIVVRLATGKEAVTLRGILRHNLDCCAYRIRARAGQSLICAPTVQHPHDDYLSRRSRRWAGVTRRYPASGRRRLCLRRRAPT